MARFQINGKQKCVIPLQRQFHLAPMVLLEQEKGKEGKSKESCAGIEARGVGVMSME